MAHFGPLGTSRKVLSFMLEEHFQSNLITPVQGRITHTVPTFINVLVSFNRSSLYNHAPTKVQSSKPLFALSLSPTPEWVSQQIQLNAGHATQCNMSCTHVPRCHVLFLKVLKWHYFFSLDLLLEKKYQNIYLEDSVTKRYRFNPKNKTIILTLLDFPSLAHWLTILG